MKNLSAVAPAIFVVSLVILGFIGWVKNIITVCHMGLDPVTGEAVVRIAGIFIAPIGAVMGWF